jgi:hypothetical protein
MSKRNRYSRDERDSPEEINEQLNAAARDAAARDAAALYYGKFSGVDDPFCSPPSPELLEQIAAAENDKDIWKPVSPALAKRIDAAVGAWKASRGRAFYEEMGGGGVAYPRRFSDKDIMGVLSVAISKMEDYFASVLEQLPPTGALTVIPGFITLTDPPGYIPPKEHVPEDDLEYVTTIVVSYAVKGLRHAASCRSSIGAERTIIAAWEVQMATEYYWLIRTALRDEAAIPFVEKVRNYQGGHKRSETTKKEKTREKHLEWLAMDLELSRDNPHWSATGRARTIGEKVGRSESRVLTVLKELREEKDDPVADS